MEFKNKTIFIISREDWGQMLMSKHHYAVELGKMGNKVYFINHPDQKHALKRGEIRITPTDYSNVSSISHRLFHPYFLKFRFNRIYNLLTRFHISKIIRKVGHKPDVVWSFDVGNSLPLKCFPKSETKIYMPVDGPFGLKDELKSVIDADIIISVSDEILEQFKYIKIPQYQVNHGVKDVFINNEITTGLNAPLRIGYSGSIVRNDLDKETFLEIIQSHQDKIFEFWGEFDYQKSNIHSPEDVRIETRNFLETLKSLDNVKLHGSVNSIQLAEGLKNMDALLICYSLKHEKGNVRNDQNHHKVLEYLGTGKAIISSYMSAYSIKYPGLMEMCSSKTENLELPGLFNKVMGNLPFYASSEKQFERINFAKQFTYSNQVLKIQNLLNKI